MQITIPNEFMPQGNYNIGITAGIESTIAPADWVEGCNRMDLILGSSKHTIDILKSSAFEKRDSDKDFFSKAIKQIALCARTLALCLLSNGF
jgi:hypothetical protein